MYFNFHHHSKGPSGIKNVRIGHSEEDLKGGEFFSAGIHPWDVEGMDIPKALSELDILLKDPKCMALGELGLDKNFGTNLDLQKEVLRSQLALALKHQKKVLIIHCIKAFQEIIEEKKKAPIHLKWVLHGFNGSSQLIAQLLQQGFYFSVGGLLLQREAKITKNLQKIPLDRLFLETDESEYPIEEIYQKAAQLLKLELNPLKVQLEHNLKLLFEENWQIKNQ